jgi:hypothetical protein
MGITRISMEEMVLLKLLGHSSLMPHHWSEMLHNAYLLFDRDDRIELQRRIFEIEKMVLETEVVPKEDEDGQLVWVERIRGKLSIYDIEMAIESNPDYYAFFRREDGRTVSKFDVERELDRLKKWVYDKVHAKASQRRFSRMR